MAPPHSASILRRMLTFRSKTVTCAPMPHATAAAALSPAIPPPITTTDAGATPGTPPIRTPRLPWCASGDTRRRGRKAAGDLAHRSEKRQRAVGGLDGLIGDRCGADANSASVHGP